MADRNYGALREAAKFEAFVDRLIGQGKPIGFDIEAGYTGDDKEGVSLLQFHPDYIVVGFSFTNSTEWARYVPVAHDDGNNVDDVIRTARALWRLLNSGLGVAHNLAYELKGLSRWFRKLLWDDPEVGMQVRAKNGFYPFRSDTMIEAFLTQEYPPAQFGSGVGKDLKGLTKHIFGHEMVKFMDLFPSEDSDLGPATPRGKTKYVRFNTRNSLNPKVIAYACEDSVWCLALHEKHYEQMKDTLIYRTEMGLLPVLVEMEEEALFLDWDLIHSKTVEVAEFRDLMNEDILNELTERLGEVININLGSVPQLSHILYERLGLPIKERSEKTNAPSTSEKALRSIAKADPVIKRILEYREVVKLYGSYLFKFDTTLNYAGTGRAHPSHNQVGAATGRMSVDGVSYQQWPKPYHYELKSGKTFDLNFRDLLISPFDYRVVGFDFSQVELRVLAGMANETTLLKAFADGVDIHKATASAMMGIPIEQVTKKQRAQGKTLNFAVVYGSGAQNIADMLTSPDEPVTKEDAEELLRKYFAGFPMLKAWMDQKVAEGREQGYVHTLFGRKFTVWDYRDPREFIRAKGDRMCVNAPVQGGAADYLKIGMVRVNKAIRKAEEAGLIVKGGIRLMMTVHDALEFYVHDSVSTQTVIDIVNPAVSFPVKGLPEIRADWHEGKTWGSVVEIKLDEFKQIVAYGLEDVEEEFKTILAAYEYQEAKKNPLTITVPSTPEGEKTLAQKIYEQGSPVEPFFTKEDTDAGERAVLGGQTLDEYLDNTPMALLTDDEVEQIRRAGIESDTNLDDEPVWAHASDPVAQKVMVTIKEMPDETQFDSFVTFLEQRPGQNLVVLSTPEGELDMEGLFDITNRDQAKISLALGGAIVSFTPLEVATDLVGDLAL